MYQDNLNQKGCYHEADRVQTPGLDLCSSLATQTSMSKKMTSPLQKNDEIIYTSLPRHAPGFLGPE